MRKKQTSSAVPFIPVSYDIRPSSNYKACPTDVWSGESGGQVKSQPYSVLNNIHISDPPYEMSWVHFEQVEKSLYTKDLGDY